VSKKKSYMNNENILAENFFSKLARLLGFPSKAEKLLRKDKKIMSGFKDLNRGVQDIEDGINAYRKKFGLGKKVKLSKYKLSDFIK
jgi:hypothetical protein|tara:strand:+ start:322 stop:579 length:258 start_codon:yes stop_codon:yes gene_type:complete